MRYTSSRYNTFGEIESQYSSGGIDEYYEYDQAGRLIRTNSGDGIDRVFLHDLAGHKTAEIRSATRQLRSMSVAEVAALTTSRLRTETRYDLAGRVIEQRQPSFTVANADVGLQAIGSLLRVGDAVLAPNNPDAIYRVEIASVDYGDGQYTDYEISSADPDATVANGGGYQYTAPTSANPGGGWAQDPGYALVAGRYIHWARPQGYVYGNGVNSIATFEFRPSSGGAWTEARIVMLPGNEIGVNLSDFANGNYDYRLTYKRPSATEPYAIATGTITVGATSSLVDTTAATVAGESLTVTSIATEVALNVPFRDADFRIGDFNAPTNAIEPFVYRQSGSGSNVTYVLDRISPPILRGGYYRTATGYEQLTTYGYQTSRLIQWNAPSDPNLVASFRYRNAGYTEWSSANITLLPGGVYSASIGGIGEGQFEFSVTYYDNSVPAAPLQVATAIGAFSIEAAEMNQSVAVTPELPDDAGTVALLGNRPAGSMNVSTSIVASATFDDVAGDGVLYTGQNDVLVTFAGLTGAVRVELEYLTDNVEAFQDPGPNGEGWPSESRRISVSLTNGALGASGVHLLWSDPMSAITSGGISQVVAVRVYSVAGDGSSTLRHSTNAADLATQGGTTIAWKAPWNPEVEATFNIRPAGTTTWEELDIARINGDFVVDVASLAAGEWEYEVLYVQNEVTRAVSGGTLTTNGGSILNTFETPPGGVYPIEAVAPVSGLFTAAINSTIVNSATHSATGTPALDAPLSFVWDEANQVDLAWADLGTDNVRVVLDYTSAERYAFNYATAGTPGWQSSAVFVPGTLASQAKDFTAGASGVSFTWEDDDAGLVGGISQLHRVRVYVLNEDTWELRLDRDVAAPRGGQSIYWDAADNSAATSSFRVRSEGATTWESRTVSATGSGLEIVDIDNLAPGNYEYQIVRSGTLTSGTFTVSTDARTHNLSLTQSNVTFDQGANDFGPVAWNGTNLSWTQAPASGDTITLRSRVVGAGTWTEENVTGAGPDYIVALTANGSEIVEFEVLYKHNGESTAYARAGGRLNVTVATERVAPLITFTQAHSVETLKRAITGFFGAGDELAWIGSTSESPQLRVRPVAGGSWINMYVNHLQEGFSADLGGLPPGEYRFEISSLNFNEVVPDSFASGTFTFGGAALGSGMSLVDTTEYSRTEITESNPNTPTQVQTLDRWGNVLAATDTSGNTTNYRYNQSNALVETILPQVQVVDTAGGIVQTTLERPETENHYDLLGRLVATRDASGHVTRATYNIAGDLLSEVATDGGVKSHVYDFFGNIAITTDQLGYRTQYGYDTLDRLFSVTREVVLGGLNSPLTTQALTTTYGYDDAGNRTRETNAAGETTRYAYFLDGSLRSKTTNRGFVTSYGYDPRGRKTSETDANGMTQRWEYDTAGRTTGYEDLSGQRTSYRYDGIGNLTYQSSTLGQRQAFYYDQAGHLTRIVDTGSPTSLADVVGVNRISEYGYDIAGRRIVERTVVDGKVHQDNAITFDSLGRIARVNDPDYEVTYSYDAVGNRTHIDANYFNHIGKGPGFVQTQDLWYVYDEVNRVVTSQGINSSGTITIGSGQGVDLTYNLRGERTSARTGGEHLRQTITMLGSIVTSHNFHRVESGLFTEHYTFDGIGRLLATDQELQTTTTQAIGGGTSTSTSTLRTNTRVFNAASRETDSYTYALDPEDDSASSLDSTHTNTTYDEDGRTKVQETYVNNVINSRVTFGDATFTFGEFVSVTSPKARFPRATTDSSFSSGSRTGTSANALKALSNGGGQQQLGADWQNVGWDRAGNLIGYTVEFFKPSNGHFKYNTIHRFDYRLGQTYQQIGERTNSSDNGPKQGSTQRTYNVNGELVQYTDLKDANKARYFANDAQGQALTVVNGKFDGRDGRLTVSRAFDNALTRTGNKVKAQYFFFANGQNIGTFGQLVDSEGTIKANFDVNYTPVSQGYPSSVPTDVIVQSGETLRSIAARVFGDASLWYVLAEANGLTSPDEVLEAGLQLQVPNKVLSLSNDARSFKPFDASLAVGDTTPTQPWPKGGCGVVGTLILAVVAVIVAAYTAGAASTALASLFGGTVTGGSALTGTLAVGFGSATTFSAGGSTAIGIGAAMAGGAAASAVTQGLSILTNYQDSFSWKGVAMGAIGAGVTAGFGFLGKFAGSSMDRRRSSCALC